MTLHDLIDDLTEYLKLTPEQQFRVTAKIKRLIHHEKALVNLLYSLDLQGDPIYDRTDKENPILVGRSSPAVPWLYDHATVKYKSHEELALLPDEKIVTWNVGTHKYNQGK